MFLTIQNQKKPHGIEVHCHVFFAGKHYEKKHRHDEREIDKRKMCGMAGMESLDENSSVSLTH